MNTDALSSRYGNIPPELQMYAQQVWRHLQQQADQTLTVHFLANFNKDHDVSLRLGTDVFKGLVVAVKPEYQLSDADRLWMHPHAYQCRAVFNGGEYTSTELPDMEASAGVYQVSSIDAIGTQCDKTYTIIDTRLPFTHAASTPREAYENHQKRETLAHCHDVASFFGAEKLESHCFTNLFLKSTTHYVFYNHGFHNQGLVHVSPLMGYRQISAKGMLAADRLHEQQYVDVHNLEDEQKKQLFTKCQWDSDSPINTYALRATYDTMHNVGTHFRLKQANFATTPIHDKMKLEDIYNLSADLNALGLSRFGNLVETQQIRLPAKPETVVKLMGLQDQLKILNPEFVDERGNLTLPKHIVEQLF